MYLSYFIEEYNKNICLSDFHTFSLRAEMNICRNMKQIFSFPEARSFKTSALIAVLYYISFRLSRNDSWSNPILLLYHVYCRLPIYWGLLPFLSLHIAARLWITTRFLFFSGKAHFLVDRPATQNFKFNKPANNMDNFPKNSLSRTYVKVFCRESSYYLPVY